MTTHSGILLDPIGTGGNAFATTATVALAQPDYQDGHMDWGDGGFVTMMILMAVFWVGVLAIAAWAVAVYARKGGGDTGNSALDIAKERYARGEITAEEFARIRQDVR